MIKFPTNARIVKEVNTPKEIIIIKEVIIVTEVKEVKELKTVKEVKIAKEVKIVKEVRIMKEVKIVNFQFFNFQYFIEHLKFKRMGLKALKLIESLLPRKLTECTSNYEYQSSRSHKN